MNKKLLFKNVIEVAALALISYIVVNASSSATIVKEGLIGINKLIELTLILIGVATTFITFLYTIISSIKEKNKGDQEVKEHLVKICRSVNRNIYRLIGAFITLLILHFIRGIDIPLIKETTNFNKDNIYAVVGAFTLMYISLSMLDITMTAVRLYQYDIEK